MPVHSSLPLPAQPSPTIGPARFPIQSPYHQPRVAAILACTQRQHPSKGAGSYQVQLREFREDVEKRIVFRPDQGAFETGVTWMP